KGNPLRWLTSSHGVGADLLFVVASARKRAVLWELRKHFSGRKSIQAMTLPSNPMIPCVPFALGEIPLREDLDSPLARRGNCGRRRGRGVTRRDRPLRRSVAPRTPHSSTRLARFFAIDAFFGATKYTTGGTHSDAGRQRADR
ncbi:unnamed protein product, partial [Scytosiphon promiscuus]